MPDKELACADCKALHDFEMAPDTGVCLLCGGNLIEDESERGLVGVGAFNKGLVELSDQINEKRKDTLNAGMFVKARVGTDQNLKN